MDIELVIKIPEEIYKASQIIDVKYEDVVQIPLEVIANGTPIPDNATNGEVFSSTYADISRTGTVLLDDMENIIATNVNVGWWNAPYQKGKEE